jgi:hypothetical protein
MKTTISRVTAALLLAVLPTRAGIIAGPITNPGNGHDYYLLTPDTWNTSEAEAEGLGGTLAIINNAAEQEWVYSKFGTYGGTDRDLWIGLHRQREGGPFVWVSGAKLDYLKWEGGQPDNAGGVENCVEISQAGHRGAWNDANENQIRNGVVEVPGSSNEKPLTKKEKALIGTWYASGDRDHPCWIAGTENRLFQIYDGRAMRLMFTVEGPLFLANGIRGEIVKDKILWNNGTWWSRRPSEFGSGEKSSFDDKTKSRSLRVIPD